MTGNHVIVGISGGIDSAVAAWRLLHNGYRVSGLFMFNWAEDEHGYCTAADDYQAARAVCAELEIPLHRADFSADYRSRVFDPFLAEYAAGHTPNPDVLCNREVKFQPFRQYALRLGAQWIATGHYARIKHTDDGPCLLRAVDENKDQTYFLASVQRFDLDRVLFPLGDMSKPDVRELGRRVGLPNYSRADSTGICFIGERPFRDFLRQYLADRPGPVEDESGHCLGTHIGLAYYTLGQRRGLSIGGVRGARELPWYVIEKDPARNALVVAQNPEHPRLLCRRLAATGFNWLYRHDTISGTLQARIRHRQRLQPCEVTIGLDPTQVSITFEEPQRAAVPGQYAVLYQGDRCLGGGRITDVFTMERNCRRQSARRVAS